MCCICVKEKIPKWRLSVSGLPLPLIEKAKAVNFSVFHCLVGGLDNFSQWLELTFEFLKQLSTGGRNHKASKQNLPTWNSRKPSKQMNFFILSAGGLSSDFISRPQAVDSCSSFFYLIKPTFFMQNWKLLFWEEPAVLLCIIAWKQTLQPETCCFLWPLCCL